jgi:hypothetical protein
MSRNTASVRYEKYVITLNNADRALAEYVAKERRKSARLNGATDNQYSSQPKEEIELQGFGGELAFCRMFSCEPDTSIGAEFANHLKNRGDTLLRGKWVDIKNTTHDQGHMLVPNYKRVGTAADWFALMVGTFPDYEFRGWMQDCEILRPERMSPRFHMWFAASQDELIICA